MNVQWKPIGQVRAIGGSLVFPRAGTAHGAYQFEVMDGTEVAAAYIGPGRRPGRLRSAVQGICRADREPAVQQSR